MGRVKVTFYGALAKIAGEKTAEVNGSALKEVVNALIKRYGQEFGEKIYDENGKLRKFVNIYINGKDIRFLSNLNTQLNEGDEISVIPAVGGG